MNRFVPAYDTNVLSKKKNSTILIIPVINEGKRILNQLKNIAKYGYSIDILIADGGSNDGSVEQIDLLKTLGICVILTKTGPGKLSSQLLTAFDYAIKNGYQNIITMDGNGKDDPEGIMVIDEALNRGFDFVQGSRFISGGSAVNTPVLRLFAIKYLHAPATSIASRKRLTDTTNGFRGFSKKLLENKDINIFRNIFYSYELIFYIPIRASRLGMKVCEVPVKRTYPKTGPVPTKIAGFTSYIKLMKILLFAILGKYNPEE